uniref:hypothetical protein n=1 Tax=Streptomyces sp. CC208A TaxID=3044573 RepID=UPI0024A9CF30
FSFARTVTLASGTPQISVQLTLLTGTPMVCLTSTGPGEAVVEVPVDHVEEVVAGIRDAARTAAGRTLTPLEHDAAWHAVEGAEDPDPGTILAAVLRALRINPPTIEDEQAASPRRMPTADSPDVVAYRDSCRPHVLLCRVHGTGWSGMTPLTADALPDGGICTWGRPGPNECGRDVLIPATELDASQPATDPPLCVWQVYREDEATAYNLYGTLDGAKRGAVHCWEEEESPRTDYQWRPFGDGWELLVGDECSGIAINRLNVYGAHFAAARRMAEEGR